jgi:coenzyme F420 hydrogenase subunit beta
MLRKQNDALDRNLGLTLSFFCAGTPSTQGTLDLMRSADIREENVSSVRYRGEGWPGLFEVKLKDGTTGQALTYNDSWGRLTSYRPLRCNLCPDGLGRVSDIACGDAWHQLAENGDIGRSLILVRTERGRKILHDAIAAGYIVASKSDGAAVRLAQKSLLVRRRELWGRFFGLRLLLIPTPNFRGFSLLRSWVTLPWKRRIQTIAGTARRAVKRNWWRPRRLLSAGR